MSAPFDPAAFYACIDAPARERNALRQDLVRGLKDYYEFAYGYDRYGAETVFRLAERMNEPFVYGFGVRRILHDRRISKASKIAAAHHALDLIQYSADGGVPYGLFAITRLLLTHDRLSLRDLRYTLVASAGEYSPFRGAEKVEYLDCFARLLDFDGMPAVERAFWGHSLIARHQEQRGAQELITLLLGSEHISADDRLELCRAWVNFRQPRLMVDIPESDGTTRATFVAEHMPFWIAHAPSWPTPAMLRHGLIWLARLGGKPHEIAQTYLTYHDTYADQAHSAVADILEEHRGAIPDASLREFVENGIRLTGSIATRRRFYRLGNDLFGVDYLTRASQDSASSVRQWAARQLHRQAPPQGKEILR